MGTSPHVIPAFDEEINIDCPERTQVQCVNQHVAAQWIGGRGTNLLIDHQRSDQQGYAVM
jgi:hypothetical protein